MHPESPLQCLIRAQKQGNFHAIHRTAIGLVKKAHNVIQAHFRRACNISESSPDKMHPTNIG